MDKFSSVKFLSQLRYAKKVAFEYKYMYFGKTRG